MQRQIRWVSAAAIAVAVVVTVSGCQKQEAKSEGGEPAQKGEEYQLSTSIPGKVVSGANGELVAEITAGKGLHLNAEYPVNFRPANNSPGIKFEQQKYDLSEAERRPCNDGTRDHCSMTAKIPFGTQAAGNEKVAGTLSFSVCNEDRCLIEKVPVEVPVQVY